MFKRFYVSITQPTHINSFLRDKLPYVFLYILFLSTFASLPNIIKAAVKNNFDMPIIKNIENTLFLIETNKEIINYELNNENEEAFFSNGGLYVISFNKSVNRFNITFNFTKNTLELYFGPVLYQVYSYEELNLENLNFNMKSNQDKDTLALLLAKLYQDIKPLLLPSIILAAVLSEMSLYLILVLISVWSYSFFRPKLKVRYRFILASYGFSIYLISSLIAELYDFNLFRLIGIIIAFTFVRKAYAEIINLRGKQSEQV